MVRLLVIVRKNGTVYTFSQKFGTHFKGPKEWREFWTGHQLRHIGISTPIPIACYWRSVGFMHKAACILTEYMPESLPIDRYIRHKLAQAQQTYESSPTIADLVSKLATVVNKLGMNKIYHRDLKVSNILAIETDDNTAIPNLIDLDGIHDDNKPFGIGYIKSINRLASSLNESTTLNTRVWLSALKIPIEKKQPNVRAMVKSMGRNKQV